MPDAPSDNRSIFQIRLRVTSGVLRELQKGQTSQKQIAISDAAPSLKAVLEAARKDHAVDIMVGGSIRLIVGDTTAIWHKHNQGETEEDFLSLFEILQRRPDQWADFICSLP